MCPWLRLERLPELTFQPRAEDDADDQRQHREPEAAHPEAQQAERSSRTGRSWTLTAYAPIEAKNRMPAYR